MPRLDRPAAALSLASCMVLACLGSCTQRPVQPAAVAPTLPAVQPPTMTDMKPRDYPGLHNVVAYHDGYYSGSVPEGATGFDTLAGMGVKTVISVDGAEPEVALAKARGMRYIHLPIGYNGFDEQRKLELVRATRDAIAQGPVYIHCHHGKHRSAGAAGTVAASLGWLTTDAATARMKVSGTAPNYQALYACTAGAVVLGAGVIDAVPAGFPEIARPTGFVKAMVEMDEISEHLKRIEKAGWKTPTDHPDLVPAAEAGRLADLLRISAQGERARSKPADFAAMLLSNADHVQRLEEQLVAGRSDAKELSAQFAMIAASCRDCHAKYRD